MAGDLGSPQTIIRYTAIALLIAAFIAYLLEFISDQRGLNLWVLDLHLSNHRGLVGFIFLFIFIVLFTLINLAALLMEHQLMLVIGTVCYTVLVIVDAIYIGEDYVYTIVLGSLAVLALLLFTFLLWKGGGK